MSFFHLYLAKVSGVSNRWRAARVPESRISFPRQVASVSFTSARKRKVAELLSACLTEPRECDYGRKKSCRGLGKRSRFEACFATVLMSFGTRLASET
jgi:hypothetical protein